MMILWGFYWLFFLWLAFRILQAVELRIRRPLTPVDALLRQIEEKSFEDVLGIAPQGNARSQLLSFTIRVSTLPRREILARHRAFHVAFRFLFLGTISALPASLPELPLTFRFVVFLTWLTGLWGIVSVEPWFLTRVGSDATYFCFGQSTNRRDRARLTSVVPVSPHCASWMHVLPDGMSMNFADGHINGGRTVTLRQPTPHTSDGWKRDLRSCVATFDEYNWSFALLFLARIQATKEAELERMLVGVEFPLSDHDRTGTAIVPLDVAVQDWKRLPRLSFLLAGLRYSGMNDQEVRVMAPSYSAALSHGCKDKASDPSQDLPEPNRVFESSGTQVAWNDTEVTLITSESTVTVPYSRLMNSSLLRRLLESVIWDKGIAYVVHQEMQTDLAQIAVAEWNLQINGSPFGNVVAQHRTVIWRAATKLIDAALLPEPDDETSKLMLRLAAM